MHELKACSQHRNLLYLKTVTVSKNLIGRYDTLLDIHTPYPPTHFDFDSTFHEAEIFFPLNSLPCLLCLRCMRDTCIPEGKMLKDPRRLYAPGRLYHIVERRPFRYKSVLGAYLVEYMLYQLEEV